MSLIFQSLQKLGTNLEAVPAGSGGHGTDVSRARWRYLRWMIPVAIGLVLVLALGCGAVYAVQYLKERLPDKLHPIEGQAASYREPPRTTFHPPGPDVEVAAADEDAVALKSREAISTDATAGAPKYRFHPPVQEKASAGGQAMARVDDKPSRLPAFDTVPETTPLPAADPQTVRSGAAEETTPVAPPVIDVQREAAERARRAALEKSARIARLVRQIEMALAGSTQAGDPAALLHQLARLKGVQHPYVAKLRAYYNFQRGNMALAQSDLQKVIAAHPDDLEAGINLAIIEIQNQHYDKAMARLKGLRQVYPENERIADLIKRLR